MRQRRNIFQCMADTMRRTPRMVRAAFLAVTVLLAAAPFAALAWAQRDLDVESDQWPTGTIDDIEQLTGESWAPRSDER